MGITYAGTTSFTSQGEAIVEVHGEIDIYTAQQLKHDLHEALGTATGGMVVDMSDVDFVDSTGLGVLLGVLRRLNEELGLPLALVIVARNVLKVFAVTGLTKVFSISPTRDEALQALAARRADRERAAQNEVE